MSVNSHYRSLLKAVGQYEDVLNGVSEDTFTKTPREGAWSYSETFSHIFHANMASLVAIEKCFLATGTWSDKRLNLAVWAILFFGRFPPGKFKAPQQIASMVKTLTREEAANLIQKFRVRLADLKSKAAQADKYQKIKHPRLGLLNARQWLRFIEIHTVHHTHQLERIQRMLAEQQKS